MWRLPRDNGVRDTQYSQRCNAVGNLAGHARERQGAKKLGRTGGEWARSLQNGVGPTTSKEKTWTLESTFCYLGKERDG